MATTGDPDGWRYVVLIANFMYQFFHHGFFKSLAVLLPSMVAQLNCSYSVAGLVSALFSATYVFCPVARYLSSKLGYRTFSVICGTAFCLCVSFLYSARTPAVVGLLLLIAGIGDSGLSLVGYVVLRENFGEQFGSANAFASLGLSIGSLVMPLLSNFLLQTYGLWGTFLILGGLLAHCIPIGAIFRSPRPSLRKRRSSYDVQESPVEAETQHEPFLSKSKPEEAYAEENKNALFQCLPIENMDAEERLCKYQVLRGEAEMNGRETENETQEEQFLERDKENASMPTDTCPTACLTIGRLLQGVAMTIIKTLALNDLWNEKEFTFLILPCQMFVDMTVGGWVLFVVTYGLSVGLDPETAPYLLTAGVSGGCLSRALSVLLLKGHQERAPVIYAFFFIAQSGGLFLYPINSSLLYLIFCSTLCGFGLYGVYSTFYAVLNVSVSEKRFSGILTSSFVIYGITVPFSSIITGRIYDVTRSLKTMFLFYGGLGCICTVLIVIFIFRRKK